MAASGNQVCVVGGWTEPRGSRPFLGSLLLGMFDGAGRLHCVGRTSAGLPDAELGRVWKRLRTLKTKATPFATGPRTRENAHWVRPALVVEVKVTGWTADGRLRHPTYASLRGDVDPKSVRLGRPESRALRVQEQQRLLQERRSRESRVRVGADVHDGPHTRAAAADRPPQRTITKTLVKNLLAQLDAIQAAAGNGLLHLPDGDALEVTNLGKAFWPQGRLTKGDLFRHYVRVAPVILPVVADRPLVMKRYPNGIDAKPFYQHRAPDKVPRGIRIEPVETENEVRPHVIGGTLKTLLYTAQLASISQDPWFSRTGSLDLVDHVAIDLDPPEGAPFRKVLDLALWVRDELAALKATGVAKTSGAGGLHVYVPMPPDTPYEAGLLFCQIVATMVAKKHPRVATVERAVKARGGRIYVDYLQNIRGKTLACAYSARASEFAGVSTPLTWDEVEAGAAPADFTIRNFGDRLDQVGDVWATLRKARGANLRAVMTYAEP